MPKKISKSVKKRVVNSRTFTKPKAQPRVKRKVRKTENV